MVPVHGHAQVLHYDVSIMRARRAAEGDEEPPPPRPSGPVKPIPPETCRYGLFWQHDCASALVPARGPEERASAPCPSN